MKNKQLNLFEKETKKQPLIPQDPAYICKICGRGNCADSYCIEETVRQTTMQDPQLSEVQRRVDERLIRDWSGKVDARYFR